MNKKQRSCHGRGACSARFVTAMSQKGRVRIAHGRALAAKTHKLSIIAMLSENTPKQKTRDALLVQYICPCATGSICTEHKPVGHLYQGVTHTTMSSAVKALTQVKVRIGVMPLLCTSAAQVTVPSVSLSTHV
jgi:hypothetical protein